MELKEVFAGISGMEIDEVAVNKVLWSRVKLDDPEAKSELVQKLEGIVLYMHLMHVGDDEIKVTLRDLEEHSIIRSVTISHAP